jgi:hypothetical protein
MQIALTAVALTLFADLAAAAPSLTVAGSVKDSAGNPIPNATVLVYSAGVFFVLPVMSIAGNVRLLTRQASSSFSTSQMIWFSICWRSRTAMRLRG